MENVRVSYSSGFKKHEGTFYNQNIKVCITKKELDYFNWCVDNLTNGISDTYQKVFLKKLKEGRNYTNITTRNYFIQFFHLKDNKRILDRNTIIKLFIKN